MTPISGFEYPKVTDSHWRLLYNLVDPIGLSQMRSDLIEKRLGMSGYLLHVISGVSMAFIQSQIARGGAASDEAVTVSL